MTKLIKELKNIHLGDDIYVIGAGASLNFINPSFFENKITIGVNQVFKKINCTYLVRKEKSKLEESLKTNSKVIISEWDSGDINKGKQLRNINGNDIPNLYYFEHQENQHRIIDFSILDSDKIIVSYSSIISALHVAAYMGAKNIILVSHDCGVLDNKFVVDGYYDSINDTPWTNWDAYKKWLGVIEAQTLKTKQVLSKKFGCNIYSLNPFINFNLEGHKIKI